VDVYLCPLADAGEAELVVAGVKMSRSQ